MGIEILPLSILLVAGIWLACRVHIYEENLSNYKKRVWELRKDPFRLSIWMASIPKKYHKDLKEFHDCLPILFFKNGWTVKNNPTIISKTINDLILRPFI